MIPKRKSDHFWNRLFNHTPQIPTGWGTSALFASHRAICQTLVLAGTLLTVSAADTPVQAEVKNLSLNGGIQDGKATLVIEAVLHGLSHDEQKLIHATSLEQASHVTSEKVTHRFNLRLDILQGQPKEIPLTLGARVRSAV